MNIPAMRSSRRHRFLLPLLCVATLAACGQGAIDPEPNGADGGKSSDGIANHGTQQDAKFLSNLRTVQSNNAARVPTATVTPTVLPSTGKLQPNAPASGVLVDSDAWCLDRNGDGIGVSDGQRPCYPAGSTAPAKLTALPDPNNPNLHTVAVFFPGQKEPVLIQAELHDGQYVYQDDIIVHPSTTAADCPAGAACGGSIRTAGLWPNNTIPYRIEAGHPRRGQILQAAQQISDNTNLRIVERTTEDDYVSIKFKANTCRSKLGKLDWVSSVFDDQTMEIGNGCSVGSIMHEFMHTAGFVHEHTRSDRTDHVEIIWNNIQSDKKHNFRKNPATLPLGTLTVPYSHNIGPYDFNSIMHYGPTYFAKISGSTTIRRRDGRTLVANRTALSAGDINAINTLYPKPAPAVVYSYNPDPKSTYLIASGLAKDKMIDIAGARTTRGTNIHLWRYNNTKAQVFEFRKTKVGYYEILAGLHDKRAIDVRGGSAANGTNIQLWDLNHTASQQFRIVPVSRIYFEFESALDPSKVLEVAGSSSVDGANIRLATRTGRRNQHFKLVRMMAPTNASRVFALETRLSQDLFLSSANGSSAKRTNIALDRLRNDARHFLRFRKYYAGFLTSYAQFNGWMQLESLVGSNRLIEAYGGGARKGANVRLYSRNGKPNQLWKLRKKGGAYFEFTNGRGYILDVSGGIGQIGRNLQIWPRNNTDAQKFKILETSY